MYSAIAVMMLVLVWQITGCVDRRDERFSTATPAPYPTMTFTDGAIWPIPAESPDLPSETGDQPDADSPPPGGGSGQDVFPNLRFENGKIYGAGLFAQDSPGGDGLLLGVGKYGLLANRDYSMSSIKSILCMAAKEGYNYYRTFANGGESVPETYISPWANTAEWKGRRDALLDAGIECRVYIQLVLFKVSGDSWNGKDVSAASAIQLADQTYLNGLDPKSARGRVLLVEHLNEPDGSNWGADEAREFDVWLKSKGWNTVSNASHGGAEGIGAPVSAWGAGDKIDIHTFKTRDVNWFLQLAANYRSTHKKAPALSTDGGPLTSEPVEYWKELFEGATRNRVSMELYLGSSSLNLFEPDVPIKLSNGWSGTTREFLRAIRQATGR